MPKKTRRRRKPPVSLSDEQLLALLAKAREHRTRDWVMILTTYWHGLRASETVGLRVRDFDLSDYSVKIRRGKGSAGGGEDAPQLQTIQEHENPLLNERLAIAAWLSGRLSHGLKGSASPLGRRARALHKIKQSEKIVKFLPEGGEKASFSTRKPAGDTSMFIPLPTVAPSASLPSGNASERVFPISRIRFWQIVHGYALAVGIPRRKCKTHMLKHTIAKHLVRAGHPLHEVQSWMGWSSIETMNWYTRADEEELGTRIGDSIRAKQGLRQMRQGSLFS